MVVKTVKYCRFCQSDDRENFEMLINTMQITTDTLDKQEDWPSGTASRHLRNHVSEYEDKSNPKCQFCISPMRDEFELAIKGGEMKSSDLAAALGTTKEQIQLHITKHLQPLVQKSAAQMIAVEELNEVDVLTGNIQKLDVKLGSLFQKEELNFKEIDALTKLAREVRESLKYLMEFKGKLVHKRQDTIIISQMQVIKEVLAQGHPDVWIDVKNKMQERLQ